MDVRDNRETFDGRYIILMIISYYIISILAKQRIDKRFTRCWIAQINQNERVLFTHLLFSKSKSTFCVRLACTERVSDTLDSSLRYNARIYDHMQARTSTASRANNRRKRRFREVARVSRIIIFFVHRSFTRCVRVNQLNNQQREATSAIYAEKNKNTIMKSVEGCFESDKTRLIRSLCKNTKETVLFY